MIHRPHFLDLILLAALDLDARSLAYDSVEWERREGAVSLVREGRHFLKTVMSLLYIFLLYIDDELQAGLKCSCQALSSPGLLGMTIGFN
jgi:hypothetical protein